MKDSSPSQGSAIESSSSREPGTWSRIVLACRDGDEGDRLCEEVGPRVGSLVASVRGWSGLVRAFYPSVPALVMLDAGMIASGEKGIHQIQSLFAEVPGLPITIVGDVNDIPPKLLLELGRLGVREHVSPRDLTTRRLAALADWTIAGRVRRLLQADRREPIPFVVAEAIDHALARRSTRLRVPELAGKVGLSSRGLRAAMSREGTPPPSRLITWGRVLWTVHDLCREPSRRAHRVARDLGFHSGTVLGNTLCRYLGVRVQGARRKGLDWAIRRFTSELVQ